MLKDATPEGEAPSGVITLDGLDGFDDNAGLVAVQAGNDVKAEGAEGSRERTFTISTAAVDRHGDTINVSGWKLEAFRKGGAVLFGHSSFAPVAAPKKTWVAKREALKSKAAFAETDFADEIFQLVDAGVLRSSSVGFRPLEMELSQERQESGEFFWPLDFKKQELLEWSVVPVPANPEALIDAKGMGIELNQWCKWAEQALDGEGGAHVDLVVPRSAIELARKSIGAAKVHSVPAAPQPAQHETTEPAPAGKGDAADADTSTAGASNDDAEYIELSESVSAAYKDAHAKALQLVGKIEERVCDAVNGLVDALKLLRSAVDDHGLEPNDAIKDALQEADEFLAAARNDEDVDAPAPAAKGSGEIVVETDADAEAQLDLDALSESDVKQIASLVKQTTTEAVSAAMGRVPH